ncbi:MAG: sugar nucleotide-binding protein [Acholeplasmatales bacterium]|nr:sugar nucleotide-binding protein [Acholeplasmatales bacterium]
MSKVCLVTGYSGMIAKEFVKDITKYGYECVIWDRKVIDIDIDNAINNYLNEVKPDLIVHFAYGRFEWSTLMALYAKNNNIKMVYISTVNVYGDNCNGNLDKESLCIPNDDYSRYKKTSEDKILGFNKNVYICRIGWQISGPEETHDNNMVEFMRREFRNNGVVKASISSYLSTSFTKDLTKEIARVIENMKPDIYLFNSNFSINFYDLLCKLNALYNLNVKIEAINDKYFDNRMYDNRVKVKNDFFK